MTDGAATEKIHVKWHSGPGRICKAIGTEFGKRPTSEPIVGPAFLGR